MPESCVVIPVRGARSPAQIFVIGAHVRVVGILECAELNMHLQLPTIRTAI